MTITEPAWPNNIGKKHRYIDIYGQRESAIIEDEIIQPGSGNHRKLIYLQKIRFNDGHLEYRFTYYMRGVKGKTKGKWVFGQYSLISPAKDVGLLLKKARAKGWHGFK